LRLGTLIVYTLTGIFSIGIAFALYRRFKFISIFAGHLGEHQVYAGIDVDNILPSSAPARVVEGDSNAEEGNDTEQLRRPGGHGLDLS
jgi:hypothetical protein